MSEIFAMVDGIYARLVETPDGGMVAERYDPGGGRFVMDMTYLTKLMAPEQAGVDTFYRMTEAEFNAAIKKL